MEVQCWLSEIDEVSVGPSEITLMGAEQGAVVLMGDAEERQAWLEKVAEAMEMAVKPMTPEYHPVVSYEQYIKPVLAADLDKGVDEALFDILREDQTIHWMGKPE